MPILPKRFSFFIDSILALLLILGASYLFIRIPQQATGTWNWTALFNAFYYYDDASARLCAGPLGIGLNNTLRLSLMSLVLSSLLGLCIALLRCSLSHVGRGIGMASVAFMRNIPPLVLVFILHFFLTGVLANAIQWNFMETLPGAFIFLPKATQMPSFFSALIALSLYEAVYVGEIIRSGIESISKTQWEAAHSLGFTRSQVLRYIILPQTQKICIPPLTSQGVSLIKDSAIVSVISVQELTFQATEYINSSGLLGEIWLGVTISYLALCFLLTAMGKFLEKRLHF